MAAFDWLLRLILALVVWLGLAYGVHRISHLPGSWNRLNLWHRLHHAETYLQQSRIFHWHHALLCFGSIEETLDIWFTLTLPALLICLLFPAQGWALLLFHYFYEILLSDQRLDHNPKICGPLTKIFAWGQFHLSHHANQHRNFGLILTFWDYIFFTAI